MLDQRRTGVTISDTAQAGLCDGHYTSISIRRRPVSGFPTVWRVDALDVVSGTLCTLTLSTGLPCLVSSQRRRTDRIVAHLFNLMFHIDEETSIFENVNPGVGDSSLLGEPPDKVA